MIKTIELIVALFLMVFCFFAGVKYSDDIKSHASWLFEGKEEEVELPDLSSENEIEIIAPIDGSTMDQAAPPLAGQGSGDVLMDSIETVPSQAVAQ